MTLFPSFGLVLYPFHSEHVVPVHFVQPLYQHIYIVAHSHIINTITICINSSSLLDTTQCNPRSLSRGIASYPLPLCRIYPIFAKTVSEGDIFRRGHGPRCAQSPTHAPLVQYKIWSMCLGGAPEVRAAECPCERSVAIGAIGWCGK